MPTLGEYKIPGNRDKFTSEQLEEIRRNHNRFPTLHEAVFGNEVDNFPPRGN